MELEQPLRCVKQMLNVNKSNMEKLSLVSGTLFLTADGFAVASLILPYWIVSDVGGESGDINVLKI